MPLKTMIAIIHNNGDYDGGEQRDIRAVADALEHIVAEQTVAAHAARPHMAAEISGFIKSDIISMRTLVTFITAMTLRMTFIT